MQVELRWYSRIGDGTSAAPLYIHHCFWAPGHQKAMSAEHTMPCNAAVCSPGGEHHSQVRNRRHVWVLPRLLAAPWGPQVEGKAVGEDP